jgi:uncharacterized membrane protein YhaH (DUF805 family)
MPRLDRRWKPVFLFVLLLLLFPATTSVARWIEGNALGIWEWLGVIAFPLLAWVWARHFSVLGCEEGCARPDKPRE